MCPAQPPGPDRLRRRGDPLYLVSFGVCRDERRNHLTRNFSQKRKGRELRAATQESNSFRTKAARAPRFARVPYKAGALRSKTFRERPDHLHYQIIRFCNARKKVPGRGPARLLLNAEWHSCGDFGSGDHGESCRSAIKSDADRARQARAQNLDGYPYLAGGGLHFNKRAETHGQSENRAVVVDPTRGELAQR